jgi:hypothetical protein
MTREEAEVLVAPYIIKIQQPHNPDVEPYPPFSAVSHLNARDLLGDVFDDLLCDKIRCLGPMNGFVYPWNVVDYLYDPCLKSKLLERRLTRAKV